MSSRSFVTVSQVNFTYPDRRLFPRLLRLKSKNPPVLRDCSFHLSAGQHAVVFGEAGSGKSTLLRLLSGSLRPASGHVTINGLPASSQATPHITPNSSSPLSATEQIFQGLSRAAASESPLIVADDIADYIGVDATLETLSTLFAGRTCLITTRHPAVAESLGLPLLILRHGSILAHATQSELSQRLACPIRLDAWIEGLRYDLIRQLKKTPGIKISQLRGCHNFNGQKICLVLNSSRYLPTAYDLLSRASLVKIKERPASLPDIINKLAS